MNENKYSFFDIFSNGQSENNYVCNTKFVCYSLLLMFSIRNV